MNAYDRGAPGMSGNAFDRWIQKSNVHDDSAITKMQHQFWVTKQTLSRKLGKKEDECIVASDAELDAKLELFRSIQESCSYLQRVIDKYQERLCNLAQEENAMGRFLKDAGKQDKTRAGKMMTAVGKSLSYSGQQRLALRPPLGRLYQEVETFRQRAIEDTLQNVQAMEKARTEYRATLSWMKNISQELDPDTSKQLERFRKVQTRVRQGKMTFDNLAFDCLQKVDLLAAARCNMFSHALVLYQNTLLNFTKKSAQAYSTIANSFKGYQRYDFMIVRELAETSTKLAQDTGGDAEFDDKDKLLCFDTDYRDTVEEGQEAKPCPASETETKNQDEKLLDIEGDSKDTLELDRINADSSTNCSENGIARRTPTDEQKELDKFFGELDLEKRSNTSNGTHVPTTEQLPSDVASTFQTDAQKSGTEFDLEMELFGGCNADLVSSSELSTQGQGQRPAQSGASDNASWLDAILNEKPQSSGNEWDVISYDTFLPPNILKQSLGDAARGIEHKSIPTSGADDKKADKSGKQKGNSWLDLFAELDPLANNPTASLYSDSNAPA